MTSQGNGYIVCKVHHGISSSKEFSKEQFERNQEDKDKKKKSIRSLPQRNMNRSTTFKNNCSPVANRMTKQNTEVIQGVAAADDLDIYRQTPASSTTYCTILYFAKCNNIRAVLTSSLCLKWILLVSIKSKTDP